MVEPAQRFGKYRGEGLLGAGAFATVWLARDDDLEDSVAIKLLSENWAASPEIRRRFVDEAKFLRQLDYDGVVRVHVIDALPDGRPYFVMTLADRGTLQDRLRTKIAAKTAFSLREALGYAIDMLDCLRVVHDFGIVHRDIKPSNVLFRSLKRHQRGRDDKDERLMLGDFGLAKDVAAASGFTLAAGTPAYMAPEQARASLDLDHRADLFSVVAVLYELVSGRPAFSATRLSGVGDAVASAPTPLQSLREGLPPELDVLVIRGLDPDRERRFQSAVELRDALAAIRDSLVDDDVPPFDVDGTRSVSGTRISSPPREPSAMPMTIALVDEVVERFGVHPATATALSRLTNPARIVVAAATSDSAAAASQALAMHDLHASLLVDANHPEAVDLLKGADVIVVVPGEGVVESTRAAIRDAAPGPVALVALTAADQSIASPDFSAIEPLADPARSIDFVRAIAVTNSESVRVSAALCILERELTGESGPDQDEIWTSIADRVDALRIANPLLAELDVLRSDAGGILRLPSSMRAEMRRVILGASPLARLGLEESASAAEARDAAEQALKRWRGYLSGGRAPFASRNAVGIVARAFERLWLELATVE